MDPWVCFIRIGYYLRLFVSTRRAACQLLPYEPVEALVVLNLYKDTVH